MSKSQRRKAQEAAHKARADNLRDRMGFSVDGRELKAGTPEYERALQSLLESTSPDELERRKPHA